MRKKVTALLLSSSLIIPANAHQHPPMGHGDLYSLYSQQCQEARSWVSAVKKTFPEIKKELRENPDALKETMRHQTEFLRSRIKIMREACFPQNPLSYRYYGI